jgi:hypothetical protein
MKEINYISIYLSIIFLFISLVRAQDADFDTSVDHFKDKVLLGT